MQILRFPSMSEAEYFGCVSAFVDSLWAALDGVAQSLGKLQGRAKGAAFLFEMQLDQHRYGALMILDRWERFVEGFGPHVELTRHREATAGTPASVEAARGLITKLNAIIDSAERYTPELAAAADMTSQAVRSAFSAAHLAADQMEKLGPMLSDEFQASKRIFRADLAAR